MKEVIFLIESDKDGGYQAHCREEGILTQADTLDELHEMIQQALACYYDTVALPTVKLQFATQIPIQFSNN
jgi:predicted RNase H-like HicB family nuclease